MEFPPPFAGRHPHLSKSLPLLVFTAEHLHQLLWALLTTVFQLQLDDPGHTGPEKFYMVRNEAVPKMLPGQIPLRKGIHA